MILLYVTAGGLFFVFNNYYFKMRTRYGAIFIALICIFVGPANYLGFDNDFWPVLLGTSAFAYLAAMFQMSKNYFGLVSYGQTEKEVVSRR